MPMLPVWGWRLKNIALCQQTSHSIFSWVCLLAHSSSAHWLPFLNPPGMSPCPDLCICLILELFPQVFSWYSEDPSVLCPDITFLDTASFPWPHNLKFLLPHPSTHCSPSLLFFFPSQALSPYNEWSNLPIYLCAVFLSWLDYEPHRVAGILSISRSRLHHPEQCLVLSRCSIKIFVEEKLEGGLREERIEWQVRIILLYNRFSHFGMKITSHVHTASLLYNLLAASLIPCVILKAFSTLVSFILISSIILRLFSCVRASGDRH